MSKDTGVCLTVDPSRAGGAFGYVDIGGWIGITDLNVTEDPGAAAKFVLDPHGVIKKAA